MKMEMLALDSGIGSRSPTPENGSHSQNNSSKVAKVTTLTNHIINNNSHTNATSTGMYSSNNTSKTKVADNKKPDTSSTPIVSAAAARSESDESVSIGISNAKNGNDANSGGDNGSSTGSSGSKLTNHGNNSVKKTYHREYNNHNRHSSGHGQYKKYGGQNHYGYNNVNFQRYNGNGHHRNYGNKNYHNNSNYHANNHYHGQSYQHHHQYGQQNYHSQNHHSQSNSNGTNSSNSNNSQSNPHHLQHQPNHSNHMNQFYNPTNYGASHPHQHQHRNAPPPQVFIDPSDTVSWTRRGGESSNNPNWSTPSLDASDTPSPSAVQIGLTLPALKQGSYTPSPQTSSPALSPSTVSTTDSTEVYTVQDDTVTVSAATSTSSSKVGETGGATTSRGNTNARQQLNTSSNIVESFHFPSPRGSRLMDAPLNGSLGPNSLNMGNSLAVGAGYPYPHFPQHPAAFYAYHGANSSHHHLGGGTGRIPLHHPHQLITHNMELLMPADSIYSMDNADSSISSNNSADKTLEWSDDGTLFSTSSGGSDRVDDYQSNNLPPPERCEYIFAPLAIPSQNGPCSANGKKRFHNGGPIQGKLSPANHYQRYHHYHPRKMMYHPGFPREFYDDLDPEDYVRAFSKFGEVKEWPKGIAKHPPSDSLSEGIWLKFLANQQTTDTFRKKMELWRDVYRVVRSLHCNANFKQDARNFPFFGLQVVGSTMSGFGSNTSDVDMCLMVRESDVDQRYEAVDKLQVMYAALSATQWLDNVELIYAKVPILKFRDPKRSLEVDLNCNNFVGIRNTHLLYCYSQSDWRLKPLVLVVKLWAHYHGINDAKNMTISSYSLVLMVIHFLQSGIKDPVLPVLQQEYPDKFSNTISILQVKINEVVPSWKSENSDTLGSLLISFLEYYAIKFDYSENAVSVRTGGTIPIKQASQHKALKNDPHQWKYLCIEEPFDRTNTARSVYDKDTFDKIIGIFHLSYKRLLASRNLESIFTPISEQDARTMSVVVRR